jgi:DNA polymerase-3 subunit delta
MGEERYFADEVLVAVREAAMKGGVAGFNEDKFTAGEAPVEKILAAAKMFPMMGPRRFVLVRGVERWESKKEDESDGDTSSRDASPLDKLADYAKTPVESTVLLLMATKLHGQRRLVTSAKKGGFLVACTELPRRDLPTWIERAAKARGHRIAPEVSDLLAEIAGPELGYVADAVERLSLYVGDGAPITEDAVAEAVTKVRPGSVWELVGAVGQRRLDRALAALNEVFDARDGGLPLLGAVAWSVKQLVKFESARAAGAEPEEAAQRAGVPPFKVREVQQTVRNIPRATMEGWLIALAEADLALKGSRRPPRAVLEAMIVSMCR